MLREFKSSFVDSAGVGAGAAGALAAFIVGMIKDNISLTINILSAVPPVVVVPGRSPVIVCSRESSLFRSARSFFFLCSL